MGPERGGEEEGAQLCAVMSRHGAHLPIVVSSIVVSCERCRVVEVALAGTSVFGNLYMECQKIRGLLVCLSVCSVCVLKYNCRTCIPGNRVPRQSRWWGRLSQARRTLTGLDYRVRGTPAWWITGFGL